MYVFSLLSVNMGHFEEPNGYSNAGETSRFADINICCLNRMYRLHKVILMQSPFFARMLLDDKNQEMIFVEGFLSLECGRDHRLTKEGMEVCVSQSFQAV